MEFTEVIKNRYACKKFDGRKVAAAQLEAILQAAVWRPLLKICRSNAFM